MFRLAHRADGLNNRIATVLARFCCRSLGKKLWPMYSSQIIRDDNHTVATRRQTTFYYFLVPNITRRVVRKSFLLHQVVDDCALSCPVGAGDADYHPCILLLLLEALPGYKQGAREEDRGVGTDYHT